MLGRGAGGRKSGAGGALWHQTSNLKTSGRGCRLSLTYSCTVDIHLGRLEGRLRADWPEVQRECGKHCI